jgi:hypothetical protein
MPTYQIPDVVEVPLHKLELPIDVPVDGSLNEKPLAECSKEEVRQAVKAFAALMRDTQKEIEQMVAAHARRRRRLAHLQAYLENFDTIAWVRR